jgi:nucleoside-diphosphate-sugar epimerase
MRIFLTGATGVVGRRLIPQLVKGGHQVSAVGRSPEKSTLLERLGAWPATVDLYDGASITQALAGHDTAINLATHIPHSSARMLLPGAWRENDRIRRITSGLLVDGALANGVARIIQESFAPVYAAQADAWITERPPSSRPGTTGR